MGEGELPLKGIAPFTTPYTGKWVPWSGSGVLDGSDVWSFLLWFFEREACTCMRRYRQYNIAVCSLLSRRLHVTQTRRLHQTHLLSA